MRPAPPLVTLTSPAGARAVIAPFGARLTALELPRPRAAPIDVVLGFTDPAAYTLDRAYQGAVIGRVAGRLARGRLPIGGAVRTLAANHHGHHLHGGTRGFDQAVWRAEPEAGGLTLRHDSPDGDEGYPGALTVEARYDWPAPFQLRLRLRAWTDAPTAVNLTHHPYFNLGGPTLAHRLTLAARAVLEVDPDLIPTGAIAPTAGGPFDFTAPKALGQSYDHTFVLEGAGLRPAAVLVAPDGALALTLHTDAPALQLYTGQHLGGGPSGKAGAPYGPHAGVCLEPQGFPDAPNHPHFPSILLTPGETFARDILYAFATPLD